MKTSRILSLIVIVTLVGGACTTGRNSANPPAHTIRKQFDALSGVTWYVTRTSNAGSNQCYEVIGEAPTGRRTHHGGLGCIVQQATEPFNRLGGGGFDVRDAGSFNFEFGAAIPGAKVVRLTLEDGHVYSDTHPGSVWFVAWQASSSGISKYEALNARGAVLVESGNPPVTQGTVDLANKEPHISVDPPQGPVGTLVHVTGDGFDEQLRDNVNSGDGYVVGLLRDFGDCELIGGDGVSAHIDDNGHLEATIRISSEGACFQDGKRHAVVPGVYGIIVGCHACIYGEFTVTASKP